MHNSLLIFCIDKPIQFARIWLSAFLSKIDCIVNYCLNFIVNLFQFFSSCQSSIDQISSQLLNWIAGEPIFLLFLRTQLIRIGQRMAAKAISQSLDQSRSFPGSRPRYSFFRDFPHRQNIHPVNLDASHAKSMSLLVNQRVRSSSLVGHPDRPFVVFHNINNRQLPQSRHIQTFKKLPVICSTIAKKTSSHAIGTLIPQSFAAVLRLKSRPRSYRNPLSHKSITSQQPVFGRKHVHRTAAALRATSFLPEQLRHYLPRRDARAQSVNVIAVGAADVIGVISAHRSNHASRDSFLTVVQVDKTKHFAPVVHLSKLILKVAPQEHILVEHQALIPRNVYALRVKNWYSPFLNHK